MMNQEQCSNCQFVHVIQGHQCSQHVCRKRAPLAAQVAPIGFTINHPPTDYDGWCGDYKAKISDPQPESEEFTQADIIKAITQYLDFGEDSFVPNKEVGAPGHMGYYSRGSWVARCLEYHLKQLLIDQVTEKFA